MLELIDAIAGLALATILVIQNYEIGSLRKRVSKIESALIVGDDNES